MTITNVTPLVMALGLPLCLTACNNSASTSDDIVIRTVGSGGGAIQIDDGFELIIPSAALLVDTEIRVERLATGPENAVGPAYLLGPEGQTFELPVTVRLPVDSVDGLPEGVLPLFRPFSAPAGSNDFTALPLLDHDEDFILTEATHCSTFVSSAISPTTLSSTEKYPRGLAVDGNQLYWASAGNAASPTELGNQGFIFSAPIGGVTTAAFSPVQEDPVAVSADDTHIYWITGGRGVNDPLGGVASTVMRASKDGSGLTTLHEGGYPGALAVDETSVYWTDRELGQIMSVPLGGGDATVLAQGQGTELSFLAIDGDSVYWTTGASLGGASGTVAKISKAGGEVVILASEQGAPAGLALSGRTLVWANQGDGRVRSISTDGGAIFDIRRTTAPRAVAISGDTVYFTDMMEGRVYAVPLSGGEATLLAGGQAIPWSIAAQGSTVFWNAAGFGDFDGAVRSISIE